MASSRDPKTFPLCDPYHGEPGAAWSRVFLPSFISGVGKKKDDFASMRNHLAGKDPGGCQPPTAAQLAANPAHTGTLTYHISGTGNPGSVKVRKSETAFEDHPVLGPM